KAKIGIMNNVSLVVNDNYETTAKGIFACGTVLTWDSDIFNSGEVGYIVGKKAAEYIKSYVY
ncbi:MAG: NAD(P)/FAD-dependent oxidoreductase, partial [Clostridium sp.]|nr:NAD(P)/FAD-dependent oxidoreductase [Clostridium sp.]